MDKKTGEISFRKALNGFNKDDVIKYISNANKRFAEKQEKLEMKAAEAEAKAAESAAELEEIRAFFRAEAEKKDEEIARLTKQIADIAENEANAVKESEQLKEMLRDCKMRLSNYIEKLSEIEASHLENIAAIEKERERTSLLQSENAKLKSKYAALDTEYNGVLTQMEKMKKTNVLSDEISALVGEIREKYDFLDEKLAAHKKLSDSAFKPTTKYDQ